MTDESESTGPHDERRAPADPDLLHGGSGENEPPDGPAPDEATDDLLNGGSGETGDSDENEPPIERKDGQVYGG